MVIRTLISILSIGIVSMPLSPADAAMRYCSPPLISIAAHGKTELEAKKIALDDWFAKAKAQGFKHSLWRTAADKKLICKTLADGGFECTAAGRACTISQVPPRATPAPSKSDGTSPDGDLGI